VGGLPLTPALLERVADRFKALAEPARLHVLAVLRDGERTVGELGEVTGLGQANLSKHLQVLHRAGFVSRRRDGLHVRYALEGDDVLRLCDLMCGRIQGEARAQADAFGPLPARSPAKAPTRRGRARQAVRTPRTSEEGRRGR
jgi:DNA-binding transcriptional ArsR family regulator